MDLSQIRYCEICSRELKQCSGGNVTERCSGHCMGSGYIIVSSVEGYVCPTCGGRGMVDVWRPCLGRACRACDGSGYLPCSH